MIAMMPHPPLPRALSFLHSRLASTPPRPAHHHIDLPAAATGADQPFATIEDGCFGAVPSSPGPLGQRGQGSCAPTGARVGPIRAGCRGSAGVVAEPADGTRATPPA
jgi:hypothetical protein